jgi:hypothetical protein
VIIKEFQNGALTPAPEVLEISRNRRHFVSFTGILSTYGHFARDSLGRCGRVFFNNNNNNNNKINNGARIIHKEI